MAGGQQAAVMGVMVPTPQVAPLPSGVMPVGTVSPPGLSTTVPSQGMMGYPQQQGIVGSVTQTQIGMMGTVPQNGKIGL